MKTILSCLVLALVLVGASVAAERVTPRERTLTRQVSILKSQVRTLKARNSRLKTQVSALNSQVTTLNGQVATLTTDRDSWIAESVRLRGLIVNEVHGLANSWRNDGNPQTDVSFFESGNYWSYSFTWCGFCS